MKKEKRLINEENLLESASDMTDEEVYEMSKGITRYLFNKYPLLSQAGWTPDDILNHQFAYFYDKQSRGKNSPLTLRYKITKKHLRNMMCKEINLACTYHLRSNKTQRLLSKNLISMDSNYMENGTLLSDIVAINIDSTDNISTCRTSEDVDREIYDEEILSIIKDERIKVGNHLYFIKLGRKPILQLNPELTKDKQEEVYELIYDESECTYKELTFRDLAKYYCTHFANKKFTTSDLKDVLVELDENGHYNSLKPRAIKNIMDKLKEEVSLNLFNGGEVLC